MPLSSSVEEREALSSFRTNKMLHFHLAAVSPVQEASIFPTQGDAVAVISAWQGGVSKLIEWALIKMEEELKCSASKPIFL